MDSYIIPKPTDVSTISNLVYRQHFAPKIKCSSMENVFAMIIVCKAMETALCACIPPIKILSMGTVGYVPMSCPFASIVKAQMNA